MLRSYKLGEADKILRVLTREHGKRSAVAKGVRKTTSRFGARLEPLTCVQLLLHEGRSMDTIRQAEIEVSFHEVREDLDLFVHASAMAELSDRITVEHEPHPELFDLLMEGLTLMRERPDRAALVLAFFEYRALASSGFELRVTACAACGCDLAAGDASFSLNLGGFVCEQCRAGRGDVGKLVTVNRQAAGLLAWMARHRLSDLPEEPSDDAGRELRFLMDRVLEHLMERESRAHRVIKVMPECDRWVDMI